VGNRTAKDSVTYTINTVNEVTALSDGTSFTYDSNGNRTQKTKGTDTWVYTYDYANRLTEEEKNSTTEGEYNYDGDGKRIQVTENNVTTTYIYSGLNVLYEENTTGSSTSIYGPTGRIAKRTTINQQSNTYYYHTDHTSSTRLVTDGNKNIVTAVTYHPFGNPCTQEGSEDYLFTGKEKDVTGLYYYGARYYDPELGRFLTRDSLKGSTANPQSLNRYTYCLNNSLKYVDPTGLWFALADEEEDPPSHAGEEEHGEEDIINPDEPISTADGGFITIETPIQWEEEENGTAVGTAVGYQQPPLARGQYTHGLVIFYKEGDDIVDYVFIPFGKPLGEKGIEEIDDFLEKHEIDLNTFNKSREDLESYCEMREKFLNDLALIEAAAGLIPGLGTLYGLGSIKDTLLARKWGKWAENLDQLCNVFMGW
jgi:RHS repeat-associated protein